MTTSRYLRIVSALFLAGFSSFSLLWSVQPLLPFFARAFDLSPASSALALSVSTAPLAVAIMLMGALSESVGRKRLMAMSLLASASLNVLAALAPDWSVLLVMRALEGMALGGAPAVAMAYLAEELPAHRLGSAMGLYVGGTATGGMSGRVLSGALVEPFGWRGSMATVGLLGLAAAIGFVLLLPPSQGFSPRRGGRRLHLAAWKRHLVDARVSPLFVIAFLVMGCFVNTYNYVGFHLSGPPFELSPHWVGLLFLVYVFGVFASSTSGVLADRFGRFPVMSAGLGTMLLGLGTTLVPNLWAVVVGVALFTMGFFAAHAVASGWVGRAARGAKGHASSLYLFSYYLGSSVVGWAGGYAWHGFGWAGSVGFAALLVLFAFAAALVLRARQD